MGTYEEDMHAHILALALRVDELAKRVDALIEHVASISAGASPPLAP